MEMPKGFTKFPHPVERPVSPLPGANNRPAPDPALPVQLTAMAEFTAKGPFCSAMALLAKREVSPTAGARKLVPHEPRKVNQSIGDQSNAIFGLLVPPKSL